MCGGYTCSPPPNWERLATSIPNSIHSPQHRDHPLTVYRPLLYHTHQPPPTNCPLSPGTVHCLFNCTSLSPQPGYRGGSAWLAWGYDKVDNAFIKHHIPQITSLKTIADYLYYFRGIDKLTQLTNTRRKETAVPNHNCMAASSNISDHACDFTIVKRGV